MLFAAGDQGLSTKQLTEVMEISHIEALNLLEMLSDSYEKSTERGIVLLELAGMFQLATKKRTCGLFAKISRSTW